MSTKETQSVVVLSTGARNKDWFYFKDLVEHMMLAKDATFWSQWWYSVQLVDDFFSKSLIIVDTLGAKWPPVTERNCVDRKYQTITIDDTTTQKAMRERLVIHIQLGGQLELGASNTANVLGRVSKQQSCKNKRDSNVKWSVSPFHNIVAPLSSKILEEGRHFQGLLSCWNAIHSESLSWSLCEVVLRNSFIAQTFKVFNCMTTGWGNLFESQGGLIVNSIDSETSSLCLTQYCVSTSVFLTMVDEMRSLHPVNVVNQRSFVKLIRKLNLAWKYQNVSLCCQPYPKN